MIWVENRVVKCLCILAGFVLQFANAFLANIIIYETTTGLLFQWNLLLKNILFWVFSLLQIAHLIFISVVNEKTKAVDKKLEQAISDGKISLVGQAVDYSKNGDFEKAHKVIKLLHKLERERM